MNQVKELNAGNKDALVGVIGDSVYLTIDVAEIGVELAEAFGTLSGLSSVIGPVGAVVGAIVFVGTDIYFAVKKVDKMDQAIHLTGWEKFKEGWRAFLGMKSERYLEELIEEKELNNQLVRQKIEFLKQHPDIQRYVFPTHQIIINCKKVSKTELDCNDPFISVSAAFSSCRERVVTREKCTTKIQENLNNVIFLNYTSTHIKWSRSKPDNPSGGKIFCYPTGDYEQVPSGGAYRCKNAIGITDLVVKPGNYTLIDLGKGNDTLSGFPNSPNIVFMDNGQKLVRGGNKDDIFVLQGNDFKGQIYGYKGRNIIDLSNFALDETELFVKLKEYFDNYGEISYIFYHHNKMVCFNLHGYNISSNCWNILLEDINGVIGRKDKYDHITCAYDTVYVNSQGGESGEYGADRIIIPSSQDYSYKMQLQLWPNTIVQNDALHGNFSYNIEFGEGDINVYLTSPHPLHNFLFNHTLFEAQDIHIDYAGHSVSFSFLSSNISNLQVHTYSKNSNTFYYLSDGTRIQVDGGNVYAMQNSNKSVDEVIQEYSAIAHRLGIFMVIRSSVNNETVSIGHGNHEVIFNDAFCKSHLVGGKGEDTYVITSGYKKLNNTEDLKIPETTIYSFNRSNQTDIIDLRQLSQQIEKDLGAKLLLESVHKDGRDVLIELFIPGNDPQDMKYVTAIRLKNAFENKWYEKMQVILNNSPININYSDGKLSLIPAPIIFSNDTQIIVITERDIDRNTELVIPKKIGQYSFYYIKDNSHSFKNDLVVTNIFDSNIGKENRYTILLSNFYEKLDKMQTLHVKFVDRRIVLKDELRKINNTIEFLGKYIYDPIFNQMNSNLVNILMPGTSANKPILGHNRGRRDIEDVQQIVKDNHDDMLEFQDNVEMMSSSSSGSSLKPIGYNVINWIRNNICNLKFLNLNPIEQIKNLFNVVDVKEKVKICDLDISDNLGYRNNKNQDDLVNKLSIMQLIEDQIIELEERKIKATKLLRELQQQLKTVERECKYDGQEQYEEELASRLLTLTERRVVIQKQYAEAAQIAVTEEINNAIEKIKQSIQDNEQLSFDYFREIETVKKMVLQGNITELYYEDRMKYLAKEIKDCNEEDIRLTNALQELEKQQEKYYTLESIVEERQLSKLEAELNIQEKKILQKEEGLAIMYRNIQDQKREAYRLKDQIKLQESKIEDLKNKLNELNHNLAAIDVEDNNLLWHDGLSYWNEVEDIKNDITYQVSKCNSMNLTSLSNVFIGNNTYKDEVFNYNSFEVQGNLLLLNLLMHKKNGIKYNNKDAIVMNNNYTDSEYAQSLAYNAYAPYNREENEENMELLGTRLC